MERVLNIGESIDTLVPERRWIIRAKIVADTYDKVNTQMGDIVPGCSFIDRKQRK